MSEKNKPFVVTDRRKFTTDGQPRPDADPSPVREVRETTPPAPAEAAAPTVPSELPPAPPAAGTAGGERESDLPPLSDEQMSQAKLAYEQTADRIDVAIRSANPGMEHAPPMSFDRLVQSVYMTAIMQLGGSASEGEQPRIDLLGARQSIDMLAVLLEKTHGNLSAPEAQLLDNALFELRMAFLEVTQALARSAAAAQQPGRPGVPGAPATPRPGGPSIVR